MYQALFCGEAAKLACLLDEYALSQNQDADFFRELARQLRREKTIGGMILKFGKHESYSDKRSTIGHSAKRYNEIMSAGNILNELGYAQAQGNKKQIRGWAIKRLQQEGRVISDTTLKNDWRSYLFFIKDN